MAIRSNHVFGATAGKMKEKKQKETVLILGATGLVGSHCLERFLTHEHFTRVVTLTRKPLDLRPGPPGHHNHVIDFERPESYHDKVAADVVVCALGTTIKKAGSRESFRRVDFYYPLVLAQAAHAAGARHFMLVYAKGAAANSRFFYNRVKGELEAAVMEIGYEQLSIFRPSLLKGDRREFRAGEEFGNFVAASLSFVIPQQWQPTPVERLADAILAAARIGAPGNKIYESGTILAGLNSETDG